MSILSRLLLVPIIHTPADLGSLSPVLERASAARFGEGRWARHQETVARFWEAVAHYLLSVEAQGLKVYQDGLPAGGELGERIVTEAARRGSPNYQLVQGLVSRGAEIVKTEDPSLLQEERQQLAALVQGRAAPETGDTVQRRERLLEERDRFIAGAINGSLRGGEGGVLFLGAYHDVLPYLEGDIEVTAVKDPHKVRAYFQELTSGGDAKRLQELSQYLASPVGHTGFPRRSPP